MIKQSYAMTSPDGLIQLARTGRFFREDHGGSFTVTKRQLLEMRDNAIDRGLEIPIKYTHAGDTYAAGWVDCMSLSVQPMGTHGHGLFGKARWTAEAKSQLEAGSLKYISPEIVWAAKRMADTKRGAAGQDVGAMMVGAALVLTPFFDMAPVSLFSALTKGTRGAKMYSHMMALVSPERLAEVSAMLVANGVAEDKSMGLAAQMLLSLVRDMIKGSEMSQESMSPEQEVEGPEIEVELPMAEMQAEGEMPVVAETKDLIEPTAQEMMPSLAASLDKVKKAFGLQATASTEALVATAEAQRKAYTALQSRVVGLEKAETERKQAAAQAVFAKYEAEGRFRFQSTDKDPKGLDAAKKIFDKGIDVFEAVFGAVQPLSTFASTSKAPAAPATSGKRYVDPTTVPAAEIQSYMAQHNVNYGEALKALLKAK